MQADSRLTPRYGLETLLTQYRLHYPTKGQGEPRGRIRKLQRACAKVGPDRGH